MTDRRVGRAVDVLVYGPLGLLAYLRDTGPSFLELFVARGRKEADTAWRAVETRLGLREPAPAPSPSVASRVADSITRFASQAAAHAGGVVSAFTTPPAATRPEEPSGRAGPSLATSLHAVPGTGAPDAGPEAGSLPISDYDALSASQVVERLEGLSRAGLERIAAYERAHRGRRTILAKIEQLLG